jgi:hypothetical protein
VQRGVDSTIQEDDTLEYERCRRGGEQEILGEGYAVVVRDQHRRIDAKVGGNRRERRMLKRVIVRAARLRRRAKSEQVKRDATESWREPLDDRLPIMAARRKSMDKEECRTDSVDAEPDAKARGVGEIACVAPRRVLQSTLRQRCVLPKT